MEQVLRFADLDQINFFEGPPKPKRRAKKVGAFAVHCTPERPSGEERPLQPQQGVPDRPRSGNGQSSLDELFDFSDEESTANLHGFDSLSTAQAAVTAGEGADEVFEAVSHKNHDITAPHNSSMPALADDEELWNIHRRSPSHEDRSVSNTTIHPSVSGLNPSITNKHLRLRPEIRIESRGDSNWGSSPSCYHQPGHYGRAEEEAGSLAVDPSLNEAPEESDVGFNSALSSAAHCLSPVTNSAQSRGDGDDADDSDGRDRDDACGSNDDPNDEDYIDDGEIPDVLMEPQPSLPRRSRLNGSRGGLRRAASSRQKDFPSPGSTGGLNQIQQPFTVVVTRTSLGISIHMDLASYISIPKAEFRLSIPPGSLAAQSVRLEDGSRQTPNSNTMHARRAEVLRSRSRGHDPWTKEEDKLLLQLKEEDSLPWKDIVERFPERSPGAVQVRYCSKLNRRRRRLHSRKSKDPDYV